MQGKRKLCECYTRFFSNNKLLPDFFFKAVTFCLIIYGNRSKTDNNNIVIDGCKLLDFLRDLMHVIYYKLFLHSFTYK